MTLEKGQVKCVRIGGSGSERPKNGCGRIVEVEKCVVLSQSYFFLVGQGSVSFSATKFSHAHHQNFLPSSYVAIKEEEERVRKKREVSGKKACVIYRLTVTPDFIDRTLAFRLFFFSFPTCPIS